jgi:hypothetical protein
MIVEVVYLSSIRRYECLGYFLPDFYVVNFWYR